MSLSDTDTGPSDIFYAAQIGDIKTVKDGLKKDQINVGHSWWGPSLIAVAAENNHDELLRFLVGQGADVSKTDGDGQGPLYFAALKSNSKIVQTLLDFDANIIDQKTTSGETPLHAAVSRPLPEGTEEEIEKREEENQKTVSSLIQSMQSHGISIDCSDENGVTPLYSASDNTLPKAIEALCKAAGRNATGDEPDTTIINVDGTRPDRRPLIAAAKRGHEASVAVLLKYGANPKLSDENEQLPLYWAAISGQKALVEFLSGYDYVKNDFPSPTPATTLLSAIRPELNLVPDDIYAKDKMGRTALHLAINISHPGYIERLVGMGCSVNAVDQSGQTPLISAVINRKVDCVQPLLSSKSIDVNIKDTEQAQTALSWAIVTGQPDIVELLLEHGSDVDSKNNDGRTPLILAIIAGNQDTTTLIMNRMPDLNIRNTRYGQSAVSYAAENDQLDIVKLLIKNRCNLYSEGEIYAPLVWAVWRGDETMLQVFFEASSGKLGEKLPRVRAIAEALHCAFSYGNLEIIDFIFAEDKYLHALDDNRRSVLSWVAEFGSEAAATQLLSKANKGEPELAADNKPKVPGHRKSSDGHPRSRPVTRKEQDVPAARTLAEPTNAAQDKAINVNSRDDRDRTPIWYAALGNHIKTTRALLAHGANPLGRDIQLKDLMECISNNETVGSHTLKTAEMRFRDEIEEILRPYFRLAREYTRKDVDTQFPAMIMEVLVGSNGEIIPKPFVVADLLNPRHPILSNIPSKVSFQWLHLPANNMKWVELLMMRHYGDQEIQKSRLVLKSKLWEDNQHIPQNELDYHERFMYPGCYMLPDMDLEEFEYVPIPADDSHGQGPTMPPTHLTRDARKKDAQSKKPEADINERGLAPNQRGIVLFVPYLHWEYEEEVEKLKGTLDEMRKRKQVVGEISQAQKNRPETPDNITHDQQLLEEYLHEHHPLHIRRTLDQYYYPSSSNLSNRDKNQTSLRYHKESANKNKTRPRLTMVDQLWMWVLPKCESSPPTIITAFPERSNITTNERWQRDLLGNIFARCSDNSVQSCYGVAEVIAAECSRYYLDSGGNREEETQFLRLYETSIARIMDRDAERFKNFRDTVKQLGSEEVSKELVAINAIQDDVEDLWQIKDIQDELNIMKSLFRVQEEVFQTMKHIVYGNMEQINMPPTNGGKQHTALYSPEAVVDRSIKDVERLESLAGKATDAVEQLLALKQKQADLILTTGIYNINDATDRQGKTILTFTVVTIIFLPLSFLASFLALDIKQFPRDEDKLLLGWVLEITLSVSLPLSTALLVIAFHLDKSQRRRTKELLLVLVKTLAFPLFQAILWSLSIILRSSNTLASKLQHKSKPVGRRGGKLVHEEEGESSHPMQNIAATID